MRRTDMQMIEDMLRHRHDGLTIAEIAAATGRSTGAVSQILARARTAGIGWPLPDGMGHRELQDAIWPERPPRPDKGRLEPDMAAAAAELTRRRRHREPRVTRFELWEAHCTQARKAGLKPYGRSRWFELLSQHLGGPGAPVEMRFSYPPGTWCLSDFSGKTLHVIGPDGPMAAEILVCVLGCSRLTFAVALEDQKVGSWAEGHLRAWEYFRGCPRSLTIDNLKAGVTRWAKDGPELNPVCAHFGRHHGIAVLPARPKHARDKGLVENAVKTVQSRVLGRLRNVRFFSLEELNRAMLERLDMLNDAPMQPEGVSRRSLFGAEEAAALKPLPANRWECADFFERKVGRDHHVRVNKVGYSVPHRYLGRRVTVRVAPATVEVFLAGGGERIAVHCRQSVRRGFATLAEHMPEAHREMAKRMEPGYGGWLLSELGAVGPKAAEWARLCMEGRDFPEQAYRTLRGAIDLIGKHGPADFEDACAAAIEQGRFTSGFLRDALKPDAVREDGEPLRPHRLIRGAEYYGSAADRGRAG